MLSWIFRALRLGGVLTSPQATPLGLQMTPPSLPGTESPRNHGSPDFILILMFVQQRFSASEQTLNSQNHEVHYMSVITRLTCNNSILLMRNSPD